MKTQRRRRKNDTVIILIAGHGTVEIPGSKNAFILTYDSDPQDLTSTALPMAEVRSLFEDQLSKVGRVILFVDVCKAGTIGTIQNTTVSADVERLGDAPGDLFGLLASRPREISLEGRSSAAGTACSVITWSRASRARPTPIRTAWWTPMS